VPEVDDDAYPGPIVDHATERAEALRRYRQIT
jgi:deoxyribodipyrimidine photo-lyase